MVQVACQIAAESYIIAIVNSKLSSEDARVVKTSGASLVMMENEYFSTSKLEFVTTQVIRSAYIPIKVFDLLPDTQTAFALHYLMPANKKFLKIAKPGVQISSTFLNKFLEAEELYIKRSDLQNWIEYAKSFDSNDSASDIRRCRLKFLQLNQSFLSLALLISDQSAAASFATGKELFTTCESFAKDLLQSLEKIPNPMGIVNTSAVGDFGSLERAPAIASYSAILSQKIGLGAPLEVMIGALLSDVGYLELSPSTSAKLRENKLKEMHGEQTMEYQKHPIYSLNQCLARKLPLSEGMKTMILQSHERMDQKGFPNRPNPEKLSEEAMLIRLSWTLDSMSQVRMGKAREPMDDILPRLIREVLEEPGSFSVIFQMKLKPALTSLIQVPTFTSQSPA
ncbi:HD domain-containing phosphohydrolase [Bdellovibrio svalbardensis]|uniref:HD-GYP domain-containing protein n=1 Tax=Bdellovibrio svalbardensis TaxID=2972972 RepID=A0ABT6DLA3_9BACT|nr:HD domain-containing phosphohydrolase [Bdellovibrio svalbardensis]MDG0817650.1 hypothetical protein [Bdellovibrio svalbardensis]